MRILHVTKKYPNAIGGDSTCVFNLEKEQVKNGDEVFILVARCRELVAKENVYTFGLVDDSCGWDRITVKRLVSLLLLLPTSLFVLKRVRPDIIHSHSADLGFLISLWAKVFKVPVILTCHTLNFPYRFISRLKRYSEWLVLKFGLFDKILVVNPHIVPLFREWGIRHNCEYASMLGVDAGDFDAAKRTLSSSERQSYTTFLFIGRIDYLKGLDYLIEAAVYFKEKSFGRFEILVIGDGPYRRVLQDKVRRMKLTENVRFLNAITNRETLVKMYCCADIFILPSLLEGFPLSILDAWAAALAVIATDVGGIRSMCSNQQAALIVPPRDITALTDAMLTLSNNIKLRESIGNNGYSLAVKKYTWQMAAGDVESHYKTLCGSRATV